MPQNSDTVGLVELLSKIVLYPKCFCLKMGKIRKLLKFKSYIKFCNFCKFKCSVLDEMSAYAQPTSLSR